MANSQRFQDRISENPNRRKLNIISQTPNTIIADIERADTVIGNQTGTPINAPKVSSVPCGTLREPPIFLPLPVTAPNPSG